MLNYNILQVDSNHFNSAARGERKLRAILTEWNRTIQQGASQTDKMIYQLDHKYTDPSVRLSTLRGTDLLRAQRLLSVGDSLGYTLYLANSEKQLHGYAETHGYDSYSRYDDYDEGSSDDEFHAIQSVTEESLELTTVFDIDGTVIMTGLDIEEENVLPWEVYEDRDPDRHEFDRWEGNSTHWFTDTVLLLVPNEYISDVFLGQSDRSDAKVLPILRHLAKRARNVPLLQAESIRNNLRRVCLIISDNHLKTISSGQTSHKYSDFTVSEAITACAEFDMIDLLPGLSSAFKDSLSANALECIRNLKHKTNLSVSEERTRLEVM